MLLYFKATFIYLILNSQFLIGILNPIFKPKEFISNYSSSKCNRTIKKLPSALIIGVKKSGTYALLRYLSINSFVKPALKVNGCKLNEIHYFDSDDNYNLGIDWYKSQMPNVCVESQKYRRTIVIEKTPGYFRSEKAVKRIYEYSSSVKLILIVRDPVKRLQSELTHCDTRQKKLNLTRKCASMNEYFKTFLKSNQSLEQNKFIRNSLYYLDLKNWLKYFRINENLLVLNGESFIRNPWFELNRVEKYLKLPNLIRKQNFHFDSEKNFYCINKENGNGMVDNATRSYLFSNGCLGKNKGRKSHVYLSEYVKSELRTYFSKWNKLFFDLIGQKFNW